MILANEMRLGSWNDYLVREDGAIFGKGGKQLKTGITQKGYACISLSINGKNKFMKVHRIVAEVFIANPLNLPTVNHKDVNKQNNHFSNLEWADHKYQREHAIKNGKGVGYKRDNNGEKGTNHKMKNHEVLLVRKLYAEGVSQVELATKFNLSTPAINHIIKRRSWKHLN